MASLSVLSLGRTLGSMLKKRRKVRRHSGLRADLAKLMYSSELWHIFHDELDVDGNGHLDANELSLALDRAGTLEFDR